MKTLLLVAVAFAVGIVCGKYEVWKGPRVKMALLVVAIFVAGVITGALTLRFTSVRSDVVAQQDNLDVPFIDDPEVVGQWQTVDFVNTIGAFSPNGQSLTGEMVLDELTFLPAGKTSKPYYTWTRGKLFHRGDRTAADYYIKQMEGVDYLFVEWKSGDYVFGHRRSRYYVLKRVAG